MNCVFGFSMKSPFALLLRLTWDIACIDWAQGTRRSFRSSDWLTHGAGIPRSSQAREQFLCQTDLLGLASITRHFGVDKFPPEELVRREGGQQIQFLNRELDIEFCHTRSREKAMNSRAIVSVYLDPVESSRGSNMANILLPGFLRDVPDRLP